MNIGDAVLVRSLKSEHFAKGDGKWAASFTFKAPKGRPFLVLLLGTINPADEAQFETETKLNALGWYFCEDCQAKHGQEEKPASPTPPER